MKRIVPIFLTGLLTVSALVSHSQNSVDRTAYSVDLKVKGHVVLPCYCKGTPRGMFDGRTPVSVTVSDSNNNPLNYKYSVTHGRIVGQGPDVIWDFSANVPPGEYTITVEVDDGVGNRSKSVTKTVTAAEPHCQCPCECPSIDIRSHSREVRRGGSVDFEAHLAGGDKENVEYAWTVENGSIKSGQGTPVIDVLASKTKGFARVTANLKVNWTGPWCGCPREASESVIIGPLTIAEVFAPTIYWLSLDETTLYIDCEPGHAAAPRSRKSMDMVVDVRTLGTGNRLNDRLRYYYSVTGGRVVGSGTDVKWDLSGVDPGTYEISVSAYDGPSESEKTKKVITVADRDCVWDPECPVISLSEPIRVGRADDFIVRANVQGGFPPETQLLWTAAGAEIIAGHGSQSVRLRAQTGNVKNPPTVQFSLLTDGVTICQHSVSLPASSR